ncbi:PEPxxWA-CTERM sorting domain-containing protein [Qipengyuania sp.]|uniref:PEPxxWA-CTERM sorting domain-containing protein n=1 Tax=Qipengyuania sp. TaxID=2004515 RepID=UPI0035C7A3A8
MKIPVSKTGRRMGLIGLSGVTIAAAVFGLVFTTGGTSGFSAKAAGSSVLSAIAERSPGLRIGGVALKSKKRRVALSPASEAPPITGVAIPDVPIASVLGASSDEGLPVIGAVSPQGGPDMFPRDFSPGNAGSSGLPGVATGGGNASSPGPGFPGIGIPGVGGGGGGGIILPQPTPSDSPTPEPTGFVPPTPGPTSEPTPEPTREPTPGPTVEPTPGPTGTPGLPGPPPAGPIPEPATWLMLIAGFGVIGSRMRQGRRIAALA